MTYEEFKKELYRDLCHQQARERQIMLLEKGVVPTDAQEVRMIRLINFSNYGREDAVIREDTICIVRKRHDVLSMLHWSVRMLYERFKKEGWQSVLPEIMIQVQQEENACGQSCLENGIAKNDRLMIRLMNYSYDRNELEDGIYWNFGDMVLALYMLIDEEEYLTVKVNRDMAEKWDMADEVMLTNALLNTYAKMPPRLYYGTDIFFRYDEEYGIFMPEQQGEAITIHPDDEQEGLHGYRLTTTRRTNGAVALFYPGVKERLAELLDGDYYVGFTSIHEAVVHPARHKVLSEMKAAIQHTNILFDQREMLTKRVYRYSCTRKELIEV